MTTPAARDDAAEVQAALAREITSCEEEHPPWPMLGEQGAVTEAALEQVGWYCEAHQRSPHFHLLEPSGPADPVYRFVPR